MMMYDELIEGLRVIAKGETDKIFSEAADVIEGLSHAVDQMTEWRKKQWIPVTERLPEYMENVLVTDGVFSGMGWRDWYDHHGTKPREDYWISPNTNVNDLGITHWMPLPQPPKDGEA